MGIGRSPQGSSADRALQTALAETARDRHSHGREIQFLRISFHLSPFGITAYTDIALAARRCPYFSFLFSIYFMRRKTAEKYAE